MCLLRHLLLVTLVAACSTEPQCLEDQEVARTIAIEDALACEYAASSYDPQDCSRFDDRVVRAYTGVFCSTAELSCIESDETTIEACFGRPLEL